MPQPEGFNPPVREGGRLSRIPNWRTLMTGFSPRSHEGSDHWSGYFCNGRSCFNPRSHEGSDVIFLIFSPFLFCFNPRSHEGSDLRLEHQQQEGESFNPRSHEGSDIAMAVFTAIVQGFNPRSHEGSDVRTGDYAVTHYPVSIHAPTRGATPCTA